jgi:hypothetical protein
MNETRDAPESEHEDSSERLPWKRPRLSRVNASKADKGGAGGPDEGSDHMS